MFVHSRPQKSTLSNKEARVTYEIYEEGESVKMSKKFVPTANQKRLADV